jgi:hypothetical protein
MRGSRRREGPQDNRVLVAFGAIVQAANGLGLDAVKVTEQIVERPTAVTLGPSHQPWGPENSDSGGELRLRRSARN